MYIISDFHDFYDIGMKSGIDKSVVYNRKTSVLDSEGKEIAMSTKIFPYQTQSHRYNEWYVSILGLAGNFYPFVYRMKDSKIVDIFWNFEEASKAINVYKDRRVSFSMFSIENEKTLKTFFNENYSKFSDLFHVHKSPIFILEPPYTGFSIKPKTRYKWIIVNPKLKDLDFIKIKHPIETYQEIYMFLSGVIGTSEKPMIEVSDEIKAASKGHDSPYSFRKTPGRRGKNRWR